jgi:hypothetical protein
MQKLNFTLPSFTRLSWVSDKARDVWKPRFDRIRQAWLEIEWHAVAAGLRRCCLQPATPEEFVAKGSRWARHGMSALPVALEGGNSANRTPKFEPGKPFVFRLVLGTPADVAEFQLAWDKQHQRTIGTLLGYPPCCYEFFRRVWVDQGQDDTTWPMAVAGSARGEDTGVVEISGPPEANILWRWLGLRAVSHLPCRCDCQETVNVARKLLALGREIGFSEEMDWLIEILRWPVEWSALHGIAEIKTPVLKIITQTDATARKYVVRRAGDLYPEEAVHGLAFPYRGRRIPLLTQSPSFQRGLENPIEIQNGPLCASAH